MKDVSPSLNLDKFIGKKSDSGMYWALRHPLSLGSKYLKYKRDLSFRLNI